MSFVLLKPDGLAPTEKTHARCPDCGEMVRNEANTCKHCGSKIIDRHVLLIVEKKPRSVLSDINGSLTWIAVVLAAVAALLAFTR